MTIRKAKCQCGDVSVACRGDPVRVSVCHCLACQRRTGSAFAAQARFPKNRAVLTGEVKTWVRTADSGTRSIQYFCPNCGSTIAYENEDAEEILAIPIGAFADPEFPAPKFSVYEERKHGWTVVLGDDVEHLD